MSPDALFNGLAKELRAEGLTVRAVAGWQTRGRPGIWDPRGVMFHHTASNRNSGDAPALGIVTHGRSDLSGPLAQFHVSRSGIVTIVAKGRANHAGTGGPFRFIPKDSGNAYAIGIECENDGRGEPWPAKQLAAIATLSAVLLNRMHYKTSRLVGHKEYTSRKIDPAGVDMNAFRQRVVKRRRTLGMVDAWCFLSAGHDISPYFVKRSDLYEWAAEGRIIRWRVRQAWNNDRYVRVARRKVPRSKAS